MQSRQHIVRFFDKERMLLFLASNVVEDFLFRSLKLAHTKVAYRLIFCGMFTNDSSYNVQGQQRKVDVEYRLICSRIFGELLKESNLFFEIFITPFFHSTSCCQNHPCHEILSLTFLNVIQTIYTFFGSIQNSVCIINNGFHKCLIIA